MRPDTVAVLPFENLSDDPENAYFSDGITGDIIASLAHIPDLHVRSRASSTRYGGTDRPARDIAAELGVGTVVTGSIRRSGSRVRVHAEVIDAGSDECLWTDTYDRPLTDLFELQNEVGAKIAEAVRRQSSHIDQEPIPAKGTTDSDAYDLYLRARSLWNQRSEAAVLESIFYFRKALDHDPRFSLAHSGLADAYTVLGIYGLHDPCEVLEAAKGAADAALSIDPKLGEATTARACIRAIYDWHWEAAEDGFKRAIALAPSYATAHQWYAVNLLAPLGRFSDAREQLQRAHDLDWISGPVSISQAIVTFFARDLKAATKELETLFAIHPRVPLVYLFLGQCYELTGHQASGADAFRQAVDLAPESAEPLAALAHCLGRTGNTSDANAILKRLQERSDQTYVSPALLAQVLIGLGRLDDALDQLELAVSNRATDLIWIGVRPVYDPLRDSPRFKKIESLVGLA